MVRHLLVTNDFLPKTGGIQAYLWELWRRLDPDSFVVLTGMSAPRGECESFDAQQADRGIKIVRVENKTLFFPTPRTLALVDDLAGEIDASLVVFDPAFPLGLLGRRLHVPYALLLHGAEVAVPARLPLSRSALSVAIRRSSLVISAGRYPQEEAMRIVGARGDGQEIGSPSESPNRPRFVEIPPGVDCKRFLPLKREEKVAARKAFGLREEGPLVVSVSRLVPRKGMDVLIEAVDRLGASLPELQLAIAGEGRDEARLQRLARNVGERRSAAAQTGAISSVRMLGAVSDEELPRLVGAADVFVMACRNRWFGLEQEGFGIVFLEAAAAGVPQVAGESGGASEAVEDGVTGFVVSHPEDPAELALAMRRLLVDERRRAEMGEASRCRALASFNYDRLASRLGAELEEVSNCR